MGSNPDHRWKYVFSTSQSRTKHITHMINLFNCITNTLLNPSSNFHIRVR